MTADRIQMVSSLKTLEQFNAERYSLVGSINKPALNGIACPKCGAELMDTNPGILLTSNPPKCYIGCSKCDYSGTRVC